LKLTDWRSVIFPGRGGFCLPSHQENYGIVVAEALACGLEVVIAEPVNISAEVAAPGAGVVHGNIA